MQDFSSFAVQYREQSLHKISPQLALATFQYLSSSIESFKTEAISENVLRRLMQHALVVRFIRVKNKDLGKSDPSTIIYQQVRPISNPSNSIHCSAVQCSDINLGLIWDLFVDTG